MISRSILRAARSSAPASRTSSQSITSSLLQSSQFARSARTAGWSTSIPQLSSSRWYSDAAPEKSAEAAKDGAAGQDAVVETLKKDLEAKTKEVVDLKDKYIRSVADYRNLQDRTKREAQSARDFAVQKFAKDLLSSTDNLEHALRSVPAEKLAANNGASAEQLHGDLVNLHKGVQMIETVLLETFKRHGITVSDPAKESVQFDPNVHEAVFHAPQPDKEDGLVFHTQQKGFLLNGRVLRAAQVGVVKNA